MSAATALAAVWTALKPFVVLGATTYATAKVENIATEKAEEDMGIRDWKLFALTREQRQKRREEGGAWWQRDARKARQYDRKTTRWAGEAWWQRGERSSPVVSSSPSFGLPGPGDPGDRTTGAGGGGDAPMLDPVLLVALAAGGAWLLLRKK